MKIPSLCKQKRKSGDLAFVRIHGTKFYCGDWGAPETEEKVPRDKNITKIAKNRKFG